jgi:cytochrome c-type protein NapB
MKNTIMAVLVLGFLSPVHGALQAGEVVVRDDQMGLSPGSVFDDPNPDVFQYPDTEPSAAQGLQRAYLGAPPQVPHRIDNLLPIRARKNACLRCHDAPDMMGKPRATSGEPTPMPMSHYVRFDDGSLKRADNRHVCVQCHTPQAEVKDLVGNTFAP